MWIEGKYSVVKAFLSEILQPPLMKILNSLLNLYIKYLLDHSGRDFSYFWTS